MHHSQIHSLRADAVRIPFCLVTDIAQLIQTLFLQCERLVCQRDGLISESRVRLRICLCAVCKIGGRIIVRVTEVLVLFVADRIDSVDELHILWKDRAEREGMDPCTAGLLFFQRRAPCDRSGQRHIVKPVHFLIIGAEPHEEQTRQRHMVLLTEIHQALCRFCLKVENVERGLRVVCYAECRSQFRVLEHLAHGLKFLCSVKVIVDRLALLNLFLKVLDISQLCLTSRLVGKIALDLFNVGCHVLRIWNTFVFRIAVQLDNVLQETDQ